MRERVNRGRIIGTSLSPGKVAEAKMRYRINMPEDELKAEDKILRESKSHIQGLGLVDVLAKPKKTYSKILKKEGYSFWSSMSRFDTDSVNDFRRLLKQEGLYKTPPAILKGEEYDDGLADRKIWSSGVSYSQLFKCKLSIKLQPGDFIVLNNLSWTHGVSNWSPNSGIRTIAAAMA